jgi:hypothetical protein
MEVRDSTRTAKPMKVVLTHEFGVKQQRKKNGRRRIRTWYPSEETEYICQIAIRTRHRYQRNTGSNFLFHVVSGLAAGTPSKTGKNVDNTTKIREQGQPFDVE